MRDISQLHPQLQSKIKELQRLCEKNNLKIGISECLRTVAEQDALYAKGRTAPGTKVTNAKGSTYSSMHQWGVAFDFYRNDGKGAYYDNDGFFTRVGKLGQSIGLEWGGSWKSPVDKPHFQLPDWGSTASILKSQYKTPEKFFATWNADPYGPNLKEEKYTMVKTSYLRVSPETGDDSKVVYSELSTTLKKKCNNKNGFAQFKAGCVFSRVREYTDKQGNSWMQIKNGYWLPAVYKKECRVEKI